MRHPCRLVLALSCPYPCLPPVQLDTLASVWGSRQKVLANVQRYPAMLSSRFAAQISTSIEALSGLGFSREQVVKAVVTLPEVTQQT